MYLNKLLLKDFGKFNNKEIDLKPGINLIYGAKAEGKTTVKNFVVSMLYGIDRSRGIGESKDVYEEYKPKDRKGFSGKAYVESNNNKYFIERSFLRRDRRVSVMDVQSGREVRMDSKESLQGTLFSVDKSTYVNALCLNHPASDKAKYIAKEMDKNVDALVNAGAKNINREIIINNLKEEKKKYDLQPILSKMDGVTERLEQYQDAPLELKNVRSKIEKLDEEFATEAAKRKREARKMIETEDGQVLYKEDARLNHKLKKVAQKEALLDAIHEKPEEKKVKLSEQLWFICLIGLLVVVTIALMVNILGFDKNVRRLYIICTFLFVVVTIIEDLYLKGGFDDDISTPSEEEFHRIIAELEEQAVAAEDEDIDYEDEEMKFATEYAEQKAVLREQEKELQEKVAKKKELDEEYASLELMKDACDKERKAITLAMDTIKNISSDISEEYVCAINGNTSDIVSRLTDGKCTDIRYDRKMHLTVCVSGDYIGISELRSELVADVNLALNIAIARYFCRNRMPVIIDDIIKTDNETRLFEIVECLNTIDTDQIIILSSDKKLADKLAKINVSFNMQEIA